LARLPESNLAPDGGSGSLGVVALHAGTKTHYDADDMSVTNAIGANDYLFR
jgi:hypothetical protein